MAWVRFRKKDMPGGLWGKCKSCSEMIFTKDLLANFNVCPKCGFHMPASVDQRVQFTLDEDSFEELYTELQPVDRLDFRDKSTYQEKLAQTAKKVGRNEAMTIGTGKIKGRDVVFGVMNFQFLGGSMGVVVGEKVTIAVELAMEKGWPLILVCASGGARMHEGALSLMQMAKTCAALGQLDQEGGLYIAILTDPTTGGVTASFATMADVILAEPDALIGFAGPRVIQNTIKQELPDGFQRSEFLLERGQIDAIVPRDELRDRLALLMEYFSAGEVAVPSDIAGETEASDQTEVVDDGDGDPEAASQDSAGSGIDNADSEPSDSDDPEAADALMDAARRRIENGAIQRRTNAARADRDTKDRAAAEGASKGAANSSRSKSTPQSGREKKTEKVKKKRK